jgi:putative ABC transport system permease protein
VVQGLAAGFVIALVTIVLTSIRVSRLNVIAAIRDLSVTHGPRRSRRRLIGLTSLVTGLLATVWSLPLQNSYLFAVGPMLVAVGVGALVATHVARRATVTGVALVVLAWGTMVIPVLSMLDVTTSIAIFVVQGFAMCAAAVALVTVHQKALGMWLSARFGGSMPVRVGLAYPVAKASRTALTLGMFALVVLTIVYISFIGLMFREQVDDLTADLSGGFGIVVTANPSDPPTDAELRAVSGVTAVAPLAYGVAPTSFAGQSGLWPVTGFGAELVAAPPVLKDRGGYATDGDAWQAVLDDPTLVIVDEFLLNTGGPVGELPAVGDTVTLADPASGDRRELTVAALAADDYLLNGAFYGLPGYRTLFGDRAVPSRFFVGAADPDGVSRAIGLAFVANGAEAVPVRSSVDAVLAQTTGFFGLMKQFVGVGLLVGIAGLGVVLVRSVRERRRDIGVLRAIGLERRPVTGAFLLEGTFVAAEGVVLGVLIALVGTWGLVLDPNTFMPNLRWTVPWRDVITVSVVTLVAAALTAAVPARRAGRIRPAQALRIVD